jgi:hypothetical protein
MKRLFLIAAMTALAIPALAADPAPKPSHPACGASADDCQKVVDAKDTQIATQAKTIQALQQQRNSIRSAADDAEVVNFVGQQAAAAQKK